MIKSVKAREIIDSRGKPTVETEIRTSEGFFSGTAPSGASTGSAEAFELRDGGKRLGGKGVLKAVKNVNKIISKLLVGREVDLEFLDSLIIRRDGTPNKRRFGGNATTSVSTALCKAGAAKNGLQTHDYIAKLAGTRACLPVPLVNLINGGKHAGLKNDFQEHMIAPLKARSFREAMEIAVDVFHSLAGLLRKRGINSNLVADEGGFVFGKTPEERLEIILKAVVESGWENKVSLAVDCAATQYFFAGKYELHKNFSPKELLKYYEELVGEYNLFSIEDPFAENDWNSWKQFTENNPALQIVGDDLLVTNPRKIRRAARERACTALLIKPNQIGTVSETLEAFKIARKAGWNSIVSHRSGETEDAFEASLAVGLGCGQCKFGAPNRGERTAKYNELLRISEKVNNFRAA